MSRYYWDSDDVYHTSRQQFNNIGASGWQSPLPFIEESSPSSVIRLAVECPFGSKKCDYTIDKSQRGRLIITARRRHIFSSDYLSLNNKNNTIIQTLTIPSDADVDHLQSHSERHTNRLIIEIPRTRSPDFFTSSAGVSQLRYDDNNQKYHNRKLEYRIDCRGYAADELDVFIEGQDLIVKGRTKRSTSSKQFSRKISLPNTVDLSKVISYFDHGELRVEAPLKREIYYSDEEILSPKRTTTAVVNRTVGGYDRVQSPIPGNHRRRYRRRERVNHQQPSSNAIQRVRSAEGLRYPLYRSLRDLEDNDEEDKEYRRNVKYKRYGTNRYHSEQQPLDRSVYESPSNGVTSRTTTYRTYPVDNDMYYNY